MSARSKAIAARAAARAADPDADPDFLALSAKQQRNIDRVFQRAIQRSSGRYSNKRRKTETPVKNEKGKGKAKAQDDEAGGFVEDAEMGGFLPDEEGGFLPDSGDEGGGFVPDDDAGDGGGFMVDDDDNGDGGFVPDEPTVSPRPRTATSATDQIPLGMISTLLASLGLPSDNDVLAVFKASATGWHADTEDAGESRVRKRDAEVNEDDLGVAKKDFRAVCAALMGPDNGAGDDDDAVSSEDLGAGDDEDDFTMDSQSDSSLSSLSASSFEGGKRGAKGSTRTPRKKSVGKGKSGDEGGSRKRKSKKKLLEEEGPIKLTLRQKDMMSDLWSLVKPKADKQGRAGRVLGKDEVKNLVRTLGEMWTDEEIADMVTLFSSQHEGRGLTYEDFGVVMLKAGLV